MSLEEGGLDDHSSQKEAKSQSWRYSDEPGPDPVEQLGVQNGVLFLALPSAETRCKPHGSSLLVVNPRDAFPLSISCDDIPQPIFDFTIRFQRSFGIIASCFRAMQSPLAPTIRCALLKLDQAAVNTTNAMMEMIKFQLQPHTSTPKSIPVPPFESSIISDISSASPSSADDDDHFSNIIAQLVELPATLSSVETHWRDVHAKRLSSQFATMPVCNPGCRTSSSA